MQPNRQPFGVTAAGEAVDLITLDNGQLSCQILTFGATLRSLLVPDRSGQATDVVLGYDTLSEYETQDGYLGAVVGRFANRISGGTFSLHETTYTLACNNGPNHLHGGRIGFSHRVWTVLDLTDTRVVLSLDSPDGEEGYPGHLTATVTYQLEGPALVLHYRALCDQDTPCNLTNHTYFNLSGHGSGPVLTQQVTLFAQHYTPTDANSIPTGVVAPVEDTPMDLRQPTPIGAHIDDSFPQLVLGRGYDHNYVVDGQAGTLRPAARVYSPQTGITLTVDTTSPGVQFYTANYLNQGRAGKGGACYGPRHAFCLETQFFPDSPNQHAFPSCLLHPGVPRQDVTRFSFQVQ
ncbi:MAG: aldose epimerase family protein [Lawsonibacter sp.]|jgi:aldose 1-epimerase